MFSISANQLYGASNVHDYERGRPEFPLSHARIAVEQVLPVNNLKGAILEIGAGSGKFTRSLHRVIGATTPSKHLRLVAVEPGGMAKYLKHSLPTIDVLDTTADCLVALKDASAAAIFCANSLHWFADNASIAEMHRVLQPGGGFGVLFLGGWGDHPFWQRGITDLIRPLYGNDAAPHLQLGKDSNFEATWKKPMLRHGGFVMHRHVQLTLPHGAMEFDEEALPAYVLSASRIAKQPPVIKASIAEGVKRLMLDPRAPHRITEEGRKLWQLPTHTELYSLVKTR